MGDSLMQLFRRSFGFKDPHELSHFPLARGAAGIATVFNTPLAGTVLTLKELSGRFEHHFSRTQLTAAMVGDEVSLGLLGNYTYFGQRQRHVPPDQGWLAILLCKVVAGLWGGLFADMASTSLAGPRTG